MVSKGEPSGERGSRSSEKKPWIKAAQDEEIRRRWWSNMVVISCFLAREEGGRGVKSVLCSPPRDWADLPRSKAG